MSTETRANFQSMVGYDRGTRSTCYVVGEEIKKLARITRGYDLNTALDEYRLLREQLGHYALETLFYEKKGENGIGYVVAVQRVLCGSSMYEALSVEPSAAQIEAIALFLKECVAMFHRCGIMPDVFGRPHVIGWYNPLRTPNVLVSGDSDHPSVYLVDVGLARLSKSRSYGILHNQLLANAARKAVERLST